MKRHMRRILRGRTLVQGHDEQGMSESRGIHMLRRCAKRLAVSIIQARGT